MVRAYIRRSGTYRIGALREPIDRSGASVGQDQCNYHAADRSFRHV